MTQVSKNTFQKGLIRDVADSLKEASSYEDALNIRLNSNGTDSEYVITNIKGDILFTNGLTKPAILTLTNNSTLTSSWVNYAYTINGIAGTPFSGTGTYVDFFRQLKESIEGTVAFNNIDIRVSLKGQRLRIWSETVSVIAFGGSFVTTSLQVAQTGQIIIGWERINDTIYLITTNNNTQQGGIGCFWKLTYDPVTFVASTELVYSDELNLSTIRPIVNPGGIESIFENDNIGRLYWTDRFNHFRSINVFDPEVMSLSPEQLSVNLNTTLRKATLDNITTGGAVISGQYTVSYILRSGNDTVTTFAPESGPIDITEQDGSVAFQNYEGNEAGNITNRKFSVVFSDIDTSYEFIDVIILRKENGDSRPFISKVAEIPITSDRIVFTYTGNEQDSIISEDKFSSIIRLFNTCHTVAQKDNILFVANTDGEDFDIDFDPRIFRFNSFGSLQLLKEDGTTSEFLGTFNDLLNTTLSEESDCIYDQDIYKYKADGITLGGEGINASYTFTTKEISADVVPSSKPSYPFRLPWREPEATYNLGDDNIYQQRSNAHPPFGNPYWHHFSRGYRREEIYRFSFVPVKNNVEGYAKWMCDIKMPAIHNDTSIGAVDFPLLKAVDSSSTNVDLYDAWNVSVLGVEFTIDISSIVDQIDGFRIKRVKVTEADRTVLAQGILHMCEPGTTANGSNSNNFHPYARTAPTTGDTAFLEYYTLNHPNTLAPGSPLRHWNIISFHSPDLIFGKGISHIPQDRLRLVTNLGNRTLYDHNNNGNNTGTFSHINYGPIAQTPTTVFPNVTSTQCGFNVGYFKLYRHFRHPLMYNTEYMLDDAKNVSIGASITMNGGGTFVNHVDSTLNKSILGTDTVAIRTSVGISGIGIQPATDLSGKTGIITTSNERYANKILANYIRPNTGQYGGRGFLARTNNIYINTNADVVLDTLNPQTSYTIKVFGGDTFISIFDTYKMVKNIPDFVGNSDYDKITGTGLFYPCETFVNTDLRHGSTFLKMKGNGWNQTPSVVSVDPDDFPIDFGEDLKYDYVWSEIPDTDRSYPRPFNVDINYRFPMRIWASAQKILGERVDSWMNFNGNSFIDVKGKLGEIRQLIVNDKRLLYFQKRGFGYVSVNERSVINDQEGTGIILGEGGVLDRFDYISETVGSWHQSSFAKSPRGIIFYDTKDGGIYFFADNIKDITEGRLKNWLYSNTRGALQTTDIPIRGTAIQKGITATYDNRNKEFLITFMDTNDIPGIFIPKTFTLSYSDTKDLIQSFRSTASNMYITDDINVFSTQFFEDRRLWLHDKGVRGSFQGRPIVPSYVKFTMNENPSLPKVYDNMEWNTVIRDNNGIELTGDTISEIEITNDYQTTGIKNIFQRILRRWKYAVGYESGTRNRMRSHWFKVKMVFDNLNDREFILHDVINFFRISPK